MTARQLYESALIELNKMDAPALKLFQFNYLVNKAITQCVNKIYNVYDTTQQTSDDLRVLVSNASLIPEGNVVYFPNDYLHLLNCNCVFTLTNKRKCKKAGATITKKATRITADSWGMVMEDYYNQPSPEQPYFYIRNRNVTNEVPTNPYIPSQLNQGLGVGTDNVEELKFQLTDKIREILVSSTYDIEGGYFHRSTESNGVPQDQYLYALYLRNEPYAAWFPKAVAKLCKIENCIIPEFNYLTSEYPLNYCYFNSAYPLTSTKDSDIQVVQFSNLATSVNVQGHNISLIDKQAAYRYGNASSIRCEILYGDDNNYILNEVKIDYVKTPQYVKLTQQQLNTLEDTSQIMEFPDYINQEIINELVHLAMEKDSNPRLAYNIQMTNTIARPTGQQQAETQAIQG